MRMNDDGKVDRIMLTKSREDDVFYRRRTDAPRNAKATFPTKSEEDETNACYGSFSHFEGSMSLMRIKNDMSTLG